MKEIILIGSFFGAIVTIVLFFARIYSIARKIENEVLKFKKDLDQNTLATLRLIINDETMPLDERVSAGDMYVAKGGNGAIHVKYDYLKEQYKQELKEGKR